MNPGWRDRRNVGPSPLKISPESHPARVCRYGSAFGPKSEVLRTKRKGLPSGGIPWLFGRSPVPGSDGLPVGAPKARNSAERPAVSWPQSSAAPATIFHLVG
jgi:hypothetical protein